MVTTFLEVQNRSVSTLASAITDSDLSLDVADGSLFPSAYPFHITIDDEILSCTNRVTNTLTVVRAQQGTAAAAHVAAVGVVLNITAQSVSDLNTAVNTLEAAGVGTTIQLVPSGEVNGGGGDVNLFVTLFKDTTGAPDRIVLVTTLTTNTVGIVEFKRLGNAWVFDPADCAHDTSVTLNFTAALQAHITAFGIDDPVSSGDRVVFIAGNNNAAPDTFEIDSIVLTPGSSSLSAVAVVIAGANQPSDANNRATCSAASSIIRVETIANDDGHFADLTEAAGTYTFTYTDAKELAIDTSINVNSSDAGGYTAIVIGSQFLLLRADSTNPVSNGAWEMNTSLTLTEEFAPFKVGLMGADQATRSTSVAAITGIDGVFAIASPVGGDGASGQSAGYIIATFPLDDI